MGRAGILFAFGQPSREEGLHGGLGCLARADQEHAFAGALEGRQGAGAHAGADDHAAVTQQRQEACMAVRAMFVPLSGMGVMAMEVGADLPAADAPVFRVEDEEGAAAAEMR